jgi:hypothetical protein
MELVRRGETNLDLDLDLSDTLRTLVGEWCGVSLARLPSVLSAEANWLPNDARLAFCEHCWDEDVRTGGQPYIRRHWLSWTAVHCATHRAFLSTKNRGIDRFGFISWQDVWASRENWREALEIQKRVPYSERVWRRTGKPQMDCEDQPLFSSLKRLTNQSDELAKGALSRVLESWQASEQRPAGINTPVLIENRIEVLRQAALLLKKHDS